MAQARMFDGPMEIVEHLNPMGKRTLYDYDKWFCGQKVRLKHGVDFQTPPRRAMNAILIYARRHDIAAVAVVERDYSVQGSPERFVGLWADKTRRWDEGPPAVVRASLEADGVKFRRPRVAKK